MVAALVKHKDPLTFVNAMKSVVSAIPNAHALMIGDGPLRPEVERAIAQSGLGENVHLAGYRTDADALLTVADVVALSSREEGLGTVLIDALWMGKPIAATRAGGIPEIVEDGLCGLLSPPEDGPALGSTISQLLMDSALRTRFSIAGRARASAFSVERTAGRTALVYERVTAAARQRKEAKPFPRLLTSQLISFFS
jgi:glycosyltransferase involved in cell wall biosynthesis